MKVSYSLKLIDLPFSKTFAETLRYISDIMECGGSPKYGSVEISGDANFFKKVWNLDMYEITFSEFINVRTSIRITHKTKFPECIVMGNGIVCNVTYTNVLHAKSYVVTNHEWNQWFMFFKGLYRVLKEKDLIDG